MPLLTATSAYGLGRRCWRSPQQCYLHCLRTWKAHTHTHTHTRLTALFPRLPGWAGTRAVKPIWILLKQRHSEWQWYQLGHMQLCTSLQTDNHASTPPLSFFTGRMPFLPPNQQRQGTEGTWKAHNCLKIKPTSWVLWSFNWRLKTTFLHQASNGVTPVRALVVRRHHQQIMLLLLTIVDAEL